MTMAEKAKTFVKQFVAFVEGDNAEVLAQKTLRQADAALKSYSAQMEGNLVDKEQAVEDAKETLIKARVNGGHPITDRLTYVRNLVEANNDVIAAEEALEDHKALMAFIEDEAGALKA